MSMAFEQTFVCSADKGYYTDIESDVFRVWKSKLRKHEEKVLQQANTQYRNDKKLEKVRQEKLRSATEGGA